VASETKPFYIDLDQAAFRDFAKSIPLAEDELLMLESYARYAAENDVTAFSTARVTDSLIARGAAENLQKLKTLANVRRLITQTAYSLKDKKFIDADLEGGEVLRIRLTDPVNLFIEDYYTQMMSNGALPFPDEEMMKRYLIPSNYVEIPDCIKQYAHRDGADRTHKRYETYVEPVLWVAHNTPPNNCRQP
jgi:hypothetical protein